MVSVADLRDCEPDAFAATARAWASYAQALTDHSATLRAHALALTGSWRSPSP